ncbi:hypothetical protein KKC52_12590 [bacterium]|nr:hypothetical protein [bacterium]
MQSLRAISALLMFIPITKEIQVLITIVNALADKRISQEEYQQIVDSLSECIYNGKEKA